MHTCTRMRYTYSCVLMRVPNMGWFLFIYHTHTYIRGMFQIELKFQPFHASHPTLHHTTPHHCSHDAHMTRNSVDMTVCCTAQHSVRRRQRPAARMHSIQIQYVVLYAGQEQRRCGVVWCGMVWYGVDIRKYESVCVIILINQKTKYKSVWYLICILFFLFLSEGRDNHGRIRAYVRTYGWRYYGVYIHTAYACVVLQCMIYTYGSLCVPGGGGVCIAVYT